MNQKKPVTVDKNANYRGEKNILKPYAQQRTNVKNIYFLSPPNLIVKKLTIQLKMGRRHEKTFHQKTNTEDK